MELYKGYIQTKNKKPLEKYKDSKNLITYNTARLLDEYGGILNDDVILVDVDDQLNSEKVLKAVDALGIHCFVIDTTRGKHFLFKNTDVTTNKTGTNTAISIKVDIKLGSRNSYEILKFNGIARKWIRKPDTLDPLPIWLQPVNSKVDFTALEEGDGRNQALFNYILALQRARFSKDEIKTTLTIINNFVLQEPLSESELNVILRDGAFLKPSFYGDKGKFYHDEFAKYIKKNDHIIKLNNVMHIYTNGVYADRQSDIEAAMIGHLPDLTAARRRETLSYLEIIAEKKEPAAVNLVALDNGIYNLLSDTLDEFDPGIVIKNRVPVQYAPDAYDQVTDRVLNKICCGDVDLRQLLEEVVGYILLRRNELGKCFILTGSGSNGKSTFIDMIKQFLGTDNYSSLALDEIGDRFKTAEIFGKLANLGDDISSMYLDNNATFKKLVTGETVNVERKGKDPFEFNNYGKMIFAANQLPRINDVTDGLMRRLILIPFNAKFSSRDSDFDPFIKDKLTSPEAMQYLLKLGIVGLKRVLQRKQFTIPEVVAAELRHYEEFNNPVLAFINDGSKIENEPTNEVYLRYSTWSWENGLKPMGSVHFSRAICRQLNLQTNDRPYIDGKRIRVFRAMGQ